MLLLAALPTQPHVVANFAELQQAVASGAQSASLAADILFPSGFTPLLINDKFTLEGNAFKLHGPPGVVSHWQGDDPSRPLFVVNSSFTITGTGINHGDVLNTGYLVMDKVWPGPLFEPVTPRECFPGMTP